MRTVARTAAAAVFWLAGMGVSQGQTSPYPSSFERESLLVWLQRETDILPARVVAVTPQALTSIVSTFPAGGTSGPRMVIRAEALSPEVFARTGSMSWHVSVNADCQGRRVKLGETTGYPQRNLLGERRVLRSADAEWRALAPGTALEQAWRAACDPAFAGPFRSSAVRLAQDDGEAHEPAAAPATPTAVPADVSPPAPATQQTAPTPQQPTPAPYVARPAPAAKSARMSRMVAQVGAGSSDAEARGLLARLSSRLNGHPTWVETADVAGRRWHRAVVGGFSDGPEAAQFCANLRAAGQACFVRAGRPG